MRVPDRAGSLPAPRLTGNRLSFASRDMAERRYGGFARSYRFLPNRFTVASHAVAGPVMSLALCIQVGLPPGGRRLVGLVHTIGSHEKPQIGTGRNGGRVAETDHRGCYLIRGA